MIGLDINLFYQRTSRNDDFGHLGMEKMLGLLKDRFFWPKMSEDVRQYIRTCGRCISFIQPVEKAEMKPILCTYLMELVHIDFLTVGHPESKKQISLIVTITGNA